MDKVDVHVHVFDVPSEQFPRNISGLAPAARAEARADTITLVRGLLQRAFDRHGPTP